MTKEKVSLLLNKMSLGYVLSLFVALINIVVVFIFKNTAIRPTYYCRWLSLVSIILCLVFALAELGLNIYRFVKNKGDKVKFIVETCFLGVAIVLLLWAFIKYFMDNGIYFYHINQTNIIFSCALIFMALFYMTKKFEERKNFQWSALLLLLMAVISFIFMIVNVKNRDITLIYTMFLMLIIALWLLVSLTFSKLGHKVTKYAFMSASIALFIASLIVTTVARTHNDTLSIINFLLMLDCLLMLCAMIFDGQSNKNLIQLILKIASAVLFLSAFIKVVVKDGVVLADMDVTRIIMFVGLVIAMLSSARLFSSKLTIGYIILQVLLGIVGIVLALTINQGTTIESYYITLAVFTFVMAGLYIAYEIIKYRASQKRIETNGKIASQQ